MATYLVSDIHLSEERPEVTQAFFSFLDSEYRHDMDELFLLGDLFEFWVGDDHVIPCAEQFQQKIQELSRSGIKIYMMHGNRDFLLGKQFAKKCGGKLIKDPTIINRFSQKFLLLHGDSLCIDDVKYQKGRAFYRKPWVKWLFLRLPLAKRLSVAEGFRDESKQESAKKQTYIMDVNQSEVIRVLRHFQCKTMIHGHTHKPKHHEYKVNQETLDRQVLGDWHSNGAYIGKITESGFQLVKFSC